MIWESRAREKSAKVVLGSAKQIELDLALSRCAPYWARRDRHNAVIRGIADRHGPMALANSVESDQKPTGGGLDQQVAERESPVVASTDFVGPQGSHENSVRSSWTAALHERFPSA